MRPTTLAIFLLTALATSPGAGAEAVRVLTGEYETTEAEDPGPIRAVFTPAERDASEPPKWSVVFIVTFDSAEYTYRGAAEGEMDRGKLVGWVENETGTRTFNFRGEHKDGRFEGAHSELIDFQETPTGTMVLRHETSEESDSGSAKP